MLTRNVLLKVDGVDIHGQLYLPGGQAPYPAVCVCHGIPAGPRDPTDRGYAQLAEKVSARGFSVLIFSFRGTGDSGGDFDIPGWVRDLKTAIDYLWSLPEIDRSFVSLLGFSGGAAVSLYVAAGDSRVSSVVSCACPAEFSFFGRQAVIEHFRSIGLFRSKGFPGNSEEWMGGFDLISPLKYVERVAPRPLLLVHGTRDEVVPADHARRLYARAGEPKELVMVEGAGHRLRLDGRAMAVAIDWLKQQRRERGRERRIDGLP